MWVPHQIFTHVLQLITKSVLKTFFGKLYGWKMSNRFIFSGSRPWPVPRTHEKWWLRTNSFAWGEGTSSYHPITHKDRIKTMSAFRFIHLGNKGLFSTCNFDFKFLYKWNDDMFCFKNSWYKIFDHLPHLWYGRPWNYWQTIWLWFVRWSLN